MSSIRAAVGGALLVLAVGCGSGGDGTPVEEQAAAELSDKTAIKARLQEIADAGYVGSGAFGLRESLEKLGDPSLLADYDRLESSQNPAQVKKLATELAAKL